MFRSILYRRGLTAISLTSQKLYVQRAMSSDYQFETLKVHSPNSHVLHVEMNRPDKRNAMNRSFWKEMVECFNKVADDPECRAVVLTGAGKAFTAGLDMMDFASVFSSKSSEDTGRNAASLHRFIKQMQESFTCIEKCPKPVIAAVHGACVGGGIDMITACDIRYCSQDAFFQIKEVDIGLAADVGTLQRMPKVVGNESIVRELAFTARRFEAEEAKQFGLVSRIFPDREALLSAAFALANQIATKSPVAVQGTKVNLIYARDHSVPESLEYMATWNASMLQSTDVTTAATASFQKEEPKFENMASKL